MGYGLLNERGARTPASTTRVRPRAGLPASLAALVVILASCGGQAAASPSAQASATASATATTEPTATATAEPTPTEAPSATTSAAACTSQPATSASQGWTELSGRDGDYRFSRPADWTDLGAGVTIATNVSVSPHTFAQTGVGADAKINVDAVRSADTITLISAWALKGVTSGTSRLFADELAWLKTQPQLKTVGDDTLQACIDGTPARGFSSAWTVVNGDKVLFIYVAQRNGTMYEIQMTTDDTAQTSTLDEAFRTWKWTAPATSGTPGNVDDQLAATKFAAFGTAAELDQSGDHPNPATFKSVFPAKSDRIYLIYELDDGVADTVDFSWKREGVEFVHKSYDYTDKTGFAWSWLTADPSTGLFRVGNYEVTATLKKAGDSITVPFKVE